MERVLYTVFYLLGEPLLYLQAVAVDVDHACHFGESGDVAVGDVGHMSLAVEGNHVVLAHREEVDVFDNDHLVVFLFEECVGEHLVRVLRVAACKNLHGLCSAHGCL